MKKSVTVIAVSVDSSYVTLFTEAGGTVTMKQGDPRITAIMETVKAPLSEVPPRPVEVSLEMPKPMLDNPEFGEAEEASGGVIRFFRVAKKRIIDWFKDEDEPATDVAAKPSGYVAPQTLGAFPGSKETTPTGNTVEALNNVTKSNEYFAEPHVKAEKQTNQQKLDLANARLDILEAEGVKPSDPKFKEELSEDETVVAVTNNGRTIIPEAQHLQSQLKAANGLKDYIGFTKFLERLGAVVNKRRFSVEDLMKFMKHGDLPIADDGSLVIYKRLTRKGKDSKGKDIYVDVHTKNVSQRVGSRVYMDESLVDPSRRNDCSNGLHVAALSYLSGFSGEITIIGKVAPEDVIAVPEYNNNKMRVSGYDILAVLTTEQANTVNRGGKLSNVEGGTELLNSILRGKHIQVNQLVHIGGQHGSNLTITNVASTVTDVEPLIPEDIRNSNLDVIADTGAIAKPSPQVNAADLKPAVADRDPGMDGLATPKGPEPKGETVKKETKAETVQRLFSEFKGASTALSSGAKAAELLAFKKASKKSWTALGLSDDIGALISDKATSVAPKVEVKTVTGFDNLSEKQPKVGSPKAKLAELVKEHKMDEEIAKSMLEIKRKAKKSWADLGVSDEVVALIESLTK